VKHPKAVIAYTFIDVGDLSINRRAVMYET
jgi:hypothetical protein